MNFFSKSISSFSVVLLVLVLPLHAQQNIIDSLKNVLRTDKADTGKVNHLNDLSKFLLQAGDYTQTLQYANIALALADTLPIGKEYGWTKGKARAYNIIGNAYNNLGNYPEALKNYLEGLKLREKLLDEAKRNGTTSLDRVKQDVAASYNNIGNVYYQQGNHNEALKNHFAAIKLREETGDKPSLSHSYTNIGNVYYDQSKNPKIQPSERDSLLNKALKYQFAALKIGEETGDQEGIGYSHNNIGIIYSERGNYAEALKNYFSCLKILEEIGDKQGIVSSYSNIASSLIRQKKNNEAGFYLKEGLKLSKEIGSKEDIKYCYFGLAELDSALGDFKSAYQHHKMFIIYRDSLLNEKNTEETVQLQMQYEFDKKESLAKAAQEKKDAIASEEKTKQKTLLLSVASGLILVLIFSIFIFNRFQITRKQKSVIENQKIIVDQKNKHITDSINYAKRIQDAIIPSQEEVSKHFPDHFIFFRPREIVSGDFYWLSHQNGKTIFAVADCTGHGVPGAFMSMIGNTLLNEIVNEKNICEPNEILNHLNEGIVRALHQESRSQDDGMDVSVCMFDKEKNKITFAGANHSLYIAGNGSMEEIKGDIYSIGSMFGKKTVSFSQKEFYLDKNSTLYFSTDGFSDQTGGAKGRKFLVKQLRDLLAGVSALGIKEQEEKITKAFEEWKGNRAQLDDVLLVGIKI